jgi:hypothetical protein
MSEWFSSGETGVCEHTSEHMLHGTACLVPALLAIRNVFRSTWTAARRQNKTSLYLLFYSYARWECLQWRTQRWSRWLTQQFVHCHINKWTLTKFLLGTDLGPSIQSIDDWYSLLTPDTVYWRLIQSIDTWYSLLTPDTVYWRLIQAIDTWYSLLTTDTVYWHLIQSIDDWYSLLTTDTVYWHLIQSIDDWYSLLTPDTVYWRLIQSIDTWYLGLQLALDYNDNF